MIKVFYNKKQSAKSNSSFSPSAQKPEQVVKYWQEKGHPIELVDFKPVTAADIALVHELEYVTKVLNCEAANGFGNTSPDVARALPWVVGSMVNAALHAYKKKENCFSPTSGAHHARYSGGGGFCTFNHLILAARMVHEAGAKKVGLIDLDAHYGDGSQDIIDRLGLSYIIHYTFGANPPRAGASADEWLKKLPRLLEKMRDCDLLIFNAGVDPHIKDPLGGTLTTEQMAERDRLVYQFAKEKGIPIVTSLAGGYQKDRTGAITPVLELHNNTMTAYRSVFEAKPKVTPTKRKLVTDVMNEILDHVEVLAQEETQVGFHCLNHRPLAKCDIDEQHSSLIFEYVCDHEAELAHLKKVDPTQTYTDRDAERYMEDPLRDEVREILKGTAYEIDDSQWSYEYLHIYVSQPLTEKTAAELQTVLENIRKLHGGKK